MENQEEKKQIIKNRILNRLREQLEILNPNESKYLFQSIKNRIQVWENKQLCEIDLEIYK